MFGNFTLNSEVLKSLNLLVADIIAKKGGGLFLYNMYFTMAK